MAPTLRYRPGHGWSVRLSAHGRRQEQGGFGEGDEGRAKAQAFADDVTRELAAHERWERRTPRQALPVDALVRDWSQVYGPLRSERTRITDKARVARLAAWFGGRDARALSEADVTAFATSVLEKRSASVAIGCLSILRRCLNLAARSGMLERNPVPEISDVMKACRERGRQGDSAPDAWTRDEVALLLQAASSREPHLVPALRFALATGARRGEIIALRWEDVDFARRRVSIRRTVTPKGGTKAPKARRGRMAPLAPSLVQVLGAELERQLRRQLEGRPAPEWVFCSPEGKLYDERNFATAWRRIRARAQKQGVRPLKFHCTRHTFITWALEAGTAAKRVSEWVGASVAVLERHYAHVLPQGEIDLGFVEVGGRAVDGAPAESEATASTRGGAGETGGLVRRSQPARGQRGASWGQGRAKSVTRVGFEPTTPSFGGSSKDSE